MLSSPDANPTLSEKDSEAIDAARAILLNLEAETTTHTRFIDGLKRDIARITDEKAYKETELTAINDKVESRNSVLDTINTEITEADTKLTALRSETETITADLANKEGQITARADAVNVLEKESSLRKDALDIREEAILAKEDRVGEAASALKDAISLITW